MLARVDSTSGNRAAAIVTLELLIVPSTHASSSTKIKPLAGIEEFLNRDSVVIVQVPQPFSLFEQPCGGDLSAVTL